VLSKAVLERELGRPVEALAYPFGGPTRFNEASKRLARAVGYRLAFSYYDGVNRPGRGDCFDVRRVDVAREMTGPRFRARVLLYRAFGRSPV
jgi:hypothetical protein